MINDLLAMAEEGVERDETMPQHQTELRMGEV
jgi:hypothetical protein